MPMVVSTLLPFSTAHKLAPAPVQGPIVNACEARSPRDTHRTHEIADPDAPEEDIYSIANGLSEGLHHLLGLP